MWSRWDSSGFEKCYMVLVCSTDGWNGDLGFASAKQTVLTAVLVYNGFVLLSVVSLMKT